MEEKQRNNAKAVASTASNDDAHYAEKEILPGIRDALSREAAKRRKNIQLSPEMRDKLLEESFPKIHRPEEDKAKELTMDEYFALRIGLQEVIQSDVKEKMILLREQLSEYHSVLEDVIAFKSRCERHEQEKQDLLSLCREACQVRDDKIALLEKELAQLRNERHSSSSSDGASSCIGIQAPALTSRTPKMSDHHYHYYKVVARRITLSPSSVPNPRSSDSSNGLNAGAMLEPLPYQESSVPLFVEMNQQQQGGLDGNPYSSRSGENRSTKRHRPT